MLAQPSAVSPRAESGLAVDERQASACHAFVDPALEFLLHVLGYVVSSHVMARGTLAKGSGRYEETLTADLRDLLALYDVCDDYLRAFGNGARMSVSVTDLPKPAEKRIGADFIIAMRGTDLANPVAQIRKVALIQAKREDYGRVPLAYAASTNHVRKAKAMARTLDRKSSYFAFYHSAAALPLLQRHVR